MRVTIFAPLLLCAACAGQPTTPSPSAPAAPVVNAAPAASSTAKKVPDSKTVAEARSMGYHVVDKGGEPLYCHRDAKTGSHLATETTCLTAKQIDDLRETTQRQMQNFQLQTPPPQGK